MTPQEIFDGTAKHLFTQGHRAGIEAEDEDGAGFECLYRAPNGCCAIGHWIPDDKYDPAMEVGSAGHDWTVDEICDRAGVGEHSALLRSLQSVHDRADSWTDTYAMRGALSSVAARYNLNVKILEGHTLPA